MRCYSLRGLAMAVAALLLPSATAMAGDPATLPPAGLAGEPCTLLPPGVWLPLGVLRERLEAGGVQVIGAQPTANDCYSVTLIGADRTRRTLLFDPVSGRRMR